MRHVQLVRLEAALEQAVAQHPDYIPALGQNNWARVADIVHEVVGHRLGSLPVSVDALSWAGYFVVDEQSREVVGSCAFKAPPNEEGVVEIAYFTYPSFEGRGYATAMARKLIALATGAPGVRQIIAHTLPEASASTRILEKVGMRFVGEVFDPDDGRVWRWQVPHGDRAQQNQDSYDRVAARYLERSRDRSLLRPWMHRFKEQLPSNAPVLDLGAGPCLDSAELRALGLRVISVDRSRHMLLAAQHEIAASRVQADMRHLPFRANGMAGVWACASLLHLDRDELSPALAGIRSVLVSSGVLFVSLKHGSGGRWDTSKYGPDTPRWFTYWSEDEVDASLESAGFEIVAAATQALLQDTWIARIACRRE